MKVMERVFDRRIGGKWKLITENTGCKNDAENRHLGTIAQLCNQGTYRQSEKNLLNGNTSSTCAHNMANFGAH